MFEQHPVPQQISSYQFRLVGDMTLKQFFQLAAGAILGLVIYATPLPGIFKWPLIVLFVVAGAAFAFLPLQERPLEEWLSAFFRAIYGPTLFRWEKTGRVSYFADVNAIATPALSAVQQAHVPAPVTAQDLSVAKLEEKENTFLSSVTSLFGGHKTAQIEAAATVTQAPSAGSIPVPVAGSVSVQPAPVPMAKVVQAQPLPTQENIVRAQTPDVPRAGSISVSTPLVTPVSVEKQAPVSVSVNQTGPVEQSTPVTEAQVKQTFNTNSIGSGGINAQFSTQAAPPAAPATPNIVVGQVMDSTGKIVEGAIIEVSDFQGRPVRAFRTNKAGHFFVVTPLPNGQYKMIVEKDNLQFDPVTFEAHGAVIPPIAIKASAANLAVNNAPATGQQQ